MQSGSEKILFSGLKRQYQNLKPEILAAVDRVYTSGQVLSGPFTTALEKDIAVRTNRKHAIAVNSCTQALQFSLWSLNNSVVILPTFSFVATRNVVLLENKTPVFIDVDSNGILDIAGLDLPGIQSNNITLMYVNLYGNMIDYDKLQTVITLFSNKNVSIIEDAAQSFGGSYKGIPSGKLGLISCLSFDPTKNLPSYSSGGMVLTDDDELATVIRRRAKVSEDSIESVGTNSQMSESSAAQLLVKLQYFDSWQKRRTDIAAYYTDRLDGTKIRLPTHSPDVIHAWHKYVIRCTPATNYELQKKLSDYNIETKIHYRYTLGAVTVPESRTSVLSLPIYPELTDVEVERVAATIAKIVSRY